MASIEQLGKMDLLEKNRDSEPRDREVHSLRSSILDGQKSKKKKRQVDEGAQTCCFCFTKPPSKPKKKEAKQETNDSTMVSGVNIGYDPNEELN